MSADTPDEKPSDRERGLDPEGRYHVKKINDPAGKHDKCRYFVLDPQHDVLARGALYSYANACLDDGREELARDLIAWVGEIETVERAIVTVTDDAGRSFDTTQRVIDDSPDLRGIFPGDRPGLEES